MNWDNPWFNGIESVRSAPSSSITVGYQPRARISVYRSESATQPSLSTSMHPQLCVRSVAVQEDVIHDGPVQIQRTWSRARCTLLP